MSETQKAESERSIPYRDLIVRAEIGTRSPCGQYAVIRYTTADGRMFRRTRHRRDWPDSEPTP